MSARQSPHGKPAGLADRLRNWTTRLSRDQTYPWLGLGIIEDLKLAATILNLEEFAQHLRTNGTDEQRQFAGEILRQGETLEALDGAMTKAGLTNFDPVAGVETIERERDQARRSVQSIRAALAEAGVIDDQTPDAELPALLKALLA